MAGQEVEGNPFVDRVNAMIDKTSSARSGMDVESIMTGLGDLGQ